MAVPDWFSAALSSPGRPGSTVVDGVQVAFRTWGVPSGRDLVLLHGGAAHGGWWDHVGPLLAAGCRRVVAVDMSGHGDSGRRSSYGIEAWAREVVAVIDAAGITAPPVVLGHSLGGYVALIAAASGALGGVIVVDSPIPEGSYGPFGPPKVYPTKEEVLGRFRLLPSQPVLPYVEEHVAAGSLREVPGGWSWKFDPTVFSRSTFRAEDVVPVPCRVVVFRAEYGVLPESDAEVFVSRLGAGVVIEIPGAGHHVMLDQPLALATGIRALLSTWD